MLLNLPHGQRDTIRSKALDRALSAKSKRVGQSAIRGKPDLIRLEKGFFQTSESNKKSLKTSSSKFML
jgi:hypothetical protein